MKRHAKAGTAVKITNGVFAGRYIKVVDYFQNQYQGKSMEKLAKTQHELLSPVKERGFPLDKEVVLAQIYPNLEFICLHDKELQVVEADPAELPSNVTSIKKATKKKDKK